MQLWSLPFSVALLWGQVADSAAAGFEVYLLAGPLELKEAVFTNPFTVVKEDHSCPLALFFCSS